VRRARILLASIVVATSLTACGDDGGGTTPPTVVETLAPEAALVLAEQRVLRAEDLPAGFALLPDDASESDDAWPAGCEYMDDWNRVSEGRRVELEYGYDGDEFPSIAHEVSILDRATATSILDAIASGPTAQCMQRQAEPLVGETEDGVTIEAVSVTSDSLDQHGDTLHYTMTTNLRRADGSLFTFKTNFVLQRVEGVLSALTTNGTAELPVPLADLESIVTDKLERA
jgi:hypothetical protein